MGKKGTRRNGSRRFRKMRGGVWEVYKGNLFAAVHRAVTQAEAEVEDKLEYIYNYLWYGRGLEQNRTLHLIEDNLGAYKNNIRFKLLFPTYNKFKEEYDKYKEFNKEDLNKYTVRQSFLKETAFRQPLPSFNQSMINPNLNKNKDAERGRPIIPSQENQQVEGEEPIIPSQETQ